MSEKNDNNCKILVIAVPSWNDRVGANTWASILSDYPSENIANICIRDEVPNSPVCSRYFCVSENRVIKSLLKRKTKTGYEVTADTSSSGEEDLAAHDELYGRMKKKRRYSMLMARELIWWLGRWKTPELTEFIDSFNPDIILHSMEGYIHINRIIEYAVKRSGAKAIGYIWDDNFTYKQHKNIGYKIYRFFQKRSLKRLARISSAFFAITEMTKKEADETFGIDCRVLTKPLNKIPEVKYESVESPLRMLYTGNLLIGRDRSLEKVAKALAEVNKDGEKLILDVYTGTSLEDEMLRRIENGFCAVHPPIPQSEVIKLQGEADILLFLEDIDGPDANVARLSFSTKLTDYLSAGKCIFAVGNTDTAPMRYLSEERAALAAAGEADIFAALRKLAECPELVREYAESAARVGINNHSPERVKEVFKDTLNEVLKER